MHFNHDGRASVHLAVDLVNAPPADADELARRCVGAGLALVGGVGEREHEGVRRVLVDWLAVVDATGEQQRASALNTLLLRWAGPPHLTDHDGGWHLHFRADDVPLDHQVAALVAVGTALHLVGRGVHRLGRCAADGCSRVWADTSRAGRQRCCSAGCGNRAAVSRHRGRARAGG